VRDSDALGWLEGVKDVDKMWWAVDTLTDRDPAELLELLQSGVDGHGLRTLERFDLSAIFIDSLTPRMGSEDDGIGGGQT